MMDEKMMDDQAVSVVEKREREGVGERESGAALDLGQARRGGQWLPVALAIIMALIIWLPRGLQLDHFVTADEHAWPARSANFYRAIARGEYADTFQRHHPGVTVTWAGTLGFLTTYPAYAEDAPRQFGWLTEEIEPFLAEQGFSAIEMLAAGRTFVVLMITLSLLASFLFARQLIGLPAALLGFGLIAFSPFHIGLSRLMHLDGLLSSFMLLSVITFLGALYRNSYRLLALSGVAAGLAWLTRSPGLFLIPFLGMVSLVEWWLNTRERTFWQTVLFMLIWGVIGLITFGLLWPAMWVDPLGSISRVLGAATSYAAEGHLKPTFFNGEVYGGDPGAIFYPLAYLWRITPITMIGLPIALIAVVYQIVVTKRKNERMSLSLRTLLILLIYALLFGLFMNLGAKKFDRYLLPSHVPLLLVSGIGWGYVGLLVRGAAARPLRKALLGVILIGAQAVFALPTFPYYLSFYNPLMGGSAEAADAMMIGWGEGADEAARAVTNQFASTDAALPVVASAYTNGPFSYFYAGETLPIYFWHLADYAVLYAQDYQRRLPAPRQIAHFESQTPIQMIWLNGIRYANVYDVAAMDLPEYVTTWGVDQPQIRLVSYQFPASVMPPGETLNTKLYLENLAPIEQDLSVVARLVGRDGAEIARSEGWPWGSPTSTWQVGDIWPDGHALRIPADTAAGFYRLEVGFVDPENGSLLDATQAATGAVLGEYLTLDYVAVGDPYADAGGQNVMKLDPPVLLGEIIQLDGAQLSSGSARAGERFSATLEWQALSKVPLDYTTFVHVVGPNGMLTQRDQPPLAGFLPTSFWHPSRRVVDTITLDIPVDAAPGTYQVHAGMYELATQTRLQITRAGAPSGDSIVVAELVVRE